MHHLAQNPRSATPKIGIIRAYCDPRSPSEALRPPGDLLARPGGEPLRGPAQILHDQSESPVNSCGDAPRESKYCIVSLLRSDPIRSDPIRSDPIRSDPIRFDSRGASPRGCRLFPRGEIPAG